MTHNITSLNIMLTEQCNFACKYCYEKHTNISMDDATLKKTIEFLYESEDDKIEYWLFGGELMLVPEKVIKAAKWIREVHEKHNCEKYVSAIIFTNGYIFDENVYKQIKESLKDILVFAQVSFDGFGKMQEARVTKGGKPTGAKVAENAVKINKIIPVIIRSTLNPDVVDEDFNLLDIVKWCIDNNIRQYAFHILQECEWTVDKQSLIFKEIDRVIEWLKEFYTYNCFNKFSIFPFYEHFRFRDDKVCRLGTKFMDISAEGNLYPCHYLYSHYKKFNKEKSFENIIGTPFEGVSEDKTKIYKELVAKYEECNKCLCKVCTPCPGVSKVFYNDLSRKPNEDYCHIMREMDKKVEKLHDFLVEKCGVANYASDWQFIIRLWIHIISMLSKIRGQENKYKWLNSTYMYFNFDFCITNKILVIKNHLLLSLRQIIKLFKCSGESRNLGLIPIYNSFIDALNKEFNFSIPELKTENLEELVDITVYIYDAVKSYET